MRRLCLTMLLMAIAAHPGAQDRDAARALVQASIDAMGGEAALKAVKSIHLDAMGHTYALEQSERPEGPHLVTYQQISEVRDHDRSRLWRRQQQRNWSQLNWIGPDMVATDDIVALSFNGRWGPHQPQQLARTKEDMALAPERMLFTALAAADLRMTVDRTVHGIVNRGVAFTWNTLRCTLYLNPHTNMPTLLRTVEDDAAGMWGDVARERFYTFWSLQPGGWQYPQQVTTTWNGQPFADYTVFGVKVNQPLEETLFAIPDETKAAFRKMIEEPPSAAMGMRGLKVDAAKAVEIAPNVLFLPGAWNVTLVRQPDGVVVLEAPIGSQYSREVIDASNARFPGVPIKAVVTTSDAWPHLAGVREYVARGIPVYALDLNLPILERLLAARHTATPDALQQRPRKPDFRVVSKKTLIGSGESRVEVFPVRGEGSERMMMAYLPGIKGLYASDLLQYNRDRSGFFHPVYPAELAAAAAREKLAVEQTWAMHMAAIPWAKVVDALAAIRGK